MSASILLDYFGKKGGQSELPSMAFQESTKHIEVSKIYKNVNDGTFSTRTLKLDLAALKRPWSDETTLHTSGNALTIQVALVPLLVDKVPYHLDVSRACFETIFGTFDLLKVREMAHCSVMTFDILWRDFSDVNKGFDCSIFMVHYCGLYLHYSEEKKSASAVLWCAHHGLSLLKAAMEDLKHLSEHPLYMLFIVVVAFNALQDFRLAQISYLLSTVEQRTGHHGDFRVAHPSAKAPLDQLSARMSGTASAIAANRRLNSMLSMILQKIKEPQLLHPDFRLSCNKIVESEISSCVRLLQDRLHIQTISIDLLEARVKNQLTAIFNMLAQNDMKLGLLVASDSQKIASAAKRDSTSMKILAAVTVVFLPATFIASLFSTSMFHWEVADDQIVTSQFWIYWAVALPLTVVTCSVCYYLSQLWASAKRSQDEEGDKAISDAFT